MSIYIHVHYIQCVPPSRVDKCSPVNINLAQRLKIVHDMHDMKYEVRCTTTMKTHKYDVQHCMLCNIYFVTCTVTIVCNT